MSTNCTTHPGCQKCQYDICKSNGNSCAKVTEQPGLPSFSRHNTKSIDRRCNLENYKTKSFFAGRKSKKYKKSKKLRKSRRRK